MLRKRLRLRILLAVSTKETDHSLRVVEGLH
jgi:hypothetical protein